MSSAVPSSRSFSPGGVTMLSQGPSWWSAGSTWTPTMPGGYVGLVIDAACPPSRPGGPPELRPLDGRDVAGLLVADVRRRLLEEHQRVAEHPHGLQEAVEHVDPDDLRGVLRVVVEVLVPQEVVDDDQVALLPRVVGAALGLGAQVGVALALEHVQPGLTGVPVHGLAAAGAELEHRHGDAGGLVADGLVEQERRPSAAGAVDHLEVVPAGVQPAVAALVLLAGDPAQPAGVGVVAGGAVGDRGARREVAELGVA